MRRQTFFDKKATKISVKNDANAYIKITEKQYNLTAYTCKCDAQYIVKQIKFTTIFRKGRLEGILVERRQNRTINMAGDFDEAHKDEIQFVIRKYKIV